MSVILPKNNLSLLYTNDIKEICQPFFAKYQLNHLNYIRLYKDKTVFYLCNNHEWLKHYYTNGYPAIGAFEQNTALANLRYVLWSALEQNDLILKDTREIFGIFHGITLINKTKDYHEFFNIGTHNKNQSILNFFINNYDILTTITKTFKEKAGKLMRLSHAQKIILPESTIEPIQQTNTSISEHYSADKFKNIHLTKTELICIKLYLTEKKPQQIANLLGISKRTVEKHIENIKLKFNCKKQLHLGYALAKADIGVL